MLCVYIYIYLYVYVQVVPYFMEINRQVIMASCELHFQTEIPRPETIVSLCGSLLLLNMTNNKVNYVINILVYVTNALTGVIMHLDKCN